MAMPAEHDDLHDDDARNVADTDFEPAAAIVPASGVAGRALFFVLTIMSFLSCMVVGTVAVIAAASAEWRSDIAGEVTVQVRPLEGVDIIAAVDEALAIVRDTRGVVDARILDEQELRDLLEPWLGAGVDLEDLPVPRLIVVDIDRSAPPNVADLRQRLQNTVPQASLDDHELWQGRLSVMANTLAVSGTAILVLVLIATVLSVVFATRGAMAMNRDIVEVLHLVGAKEVFIAREFERHFLRLGLRGGIAGGIAAMAAFGTIRWISAQFAATPAGDQFDALFGSISIGWTAFAGIAMTVLLVAALTAMSSRLTVFHFLRVFD